MDTGKIWGQEIEATLTQEVILRGQEVYGDRK